MVGVSNGADTKPTVGPSRDTTVDCLKVVLTLAVISAHCAITYGAKGGWFYRETTADGTLQQILDLPIAVGALFAMGAFFYVAGCFVPRSLDRKGPRRFVAARARRLGVPVVVFVLAVVPLIEWSVGKAAGPHTSLGDVFRRQATALDAGPLWFAAALLAFSVSVAAANAWGWLPSQSERPLTASALMATAAAVALFSFLFRLRFPIDSFQVGSLHIWQWGQCIALFALGLTRGRMGLAQPDRKLSRACKASVGMGLAGVLLILATAADLAQFGGGLRWQSAAAAVLEGVIATAAPVTLLDVCRHHRPPRQLRADAAFGAYVLQAPVIVTFALLMRSTPLPAGVKLAILIPTSVATCFFLARLAGRLVLRDASRHPHAV